MQFIILVEICTSLNPSEGGTLIKDRFSFSGVRFVRVDVRAVHVDVQFSFDDACFSLIDDQLSLVDVNLPKSLLP